MQLSRAITCRLMKLPGRVISPSASKPNRSMPGGIFYTATVSPLKKKSNGRKVADPFTFVTLPGIRWSWLRLGFGDCRVGGERCRTSSARLHLDEQFGRWLGKVTKKCWT